MSVSVCLYISITHTSSDSKQHMLKNDGIDKKKSLRTYTFAAGHVHIHTHHREIKMISV